LLENGLQSLLKGAVTLKRLIWLLQFAWIVIAIFAFLTYHTLEALGIAITTYRWIIFADIISLLAIILVFVLLFFVFKSNPEEKKGNRPKF